MLDYLSSQCINNAQELKFKKDVFKFISDQSDQNVYNAFLLFSIIIIQVLSSLFYLERIVKDSVIEYQRQVLEEKDLE